MGNKQKTWTRLDDPPSTLDKGSCVQINDHEIMFATYIWPNCLKEHLKGVIPGFYTYNFINKEWTLWMKYPENWKSVGNQLLFDSIRNELYLWCTTGGDGYQNVS